MKNLVILIGNVGQAPDVKVFSEKKVANITLATSENYKDKSGNKITNTEWHNVVFFGKLAEIVEKFVKKGDKLYLEGKIKYESYEKEGIKKYITKIIGNQLIMLGAKDNSTKFEKPQNPAETTVEDLPEDDLPF